MNKTIKSAVAGVAVVAALALGTAASAEAAPVETVGQSSIQPKSITHPCYAKAIYGNGPGLKNYRAYDAWCGADGQSGDEWWGPWRLKKSSAQSDAKTHNAQWD